jgi:hypothetical protein
MSRHVCLTACSAHNNLAAGQLVTSERGVCGDPWLSILLILCHILHFISHWLVLDHLIVNLAGLD